MSWIVNSKLIKFQRTLYTIFLFEKSAIYLLCQNHIQHQDVSTHNHLQETSIPNFTTTRTSFFLEFQPFFPWICYNYDLKNNIPKIYHLCFSHRFFGVSFFFLHPARPSLPRCLWLFLPGGAPTRWGREREVYQASELCLFLFFGKTNGKTFGEIIGFLNTFCFLFFFPNIFFIFGKTMENTSCSPLVPTFPPGNAALRDWFPPYCRPYFNGGWHDHVMKTGGFARLWWHAQLIQKRADFGWQNLAPKCTWKLLEKQYI